MSAFLHQKRISAILIAVVTIGCGILFLFYGVEAAAVICRFAGILLALIGAFYIFSFIIAKAERVLSTWGSLLAGILCFAAGLWMAVRPLTAIQYLQYVIAIVVLLHGIIDLQASFHLVRARARLWIYALVSSIVTLGLGTWILLSPMGATKALMILMGVVLIVDGITDLILIAPHRPPLKKRSGGIAAGGRGGGNHRYHRRKTDRITEKLCRWQSFFIRIPFCSGPVPSPAWDSAAARRTPWS